MVQTRAFYALRSLVLSGTFALGLTACGGGSPPPAESAHAQTPSFEASVREADDSSSADEAPAVAEEAPRRPSCDDGTCTPCGDGICPSGWYCDENAQGGPACGWLPACAKKPSCACLTRALSGCRCEERQGGLYLNCG